MAESQEPQTLEEWKQAYFEVFRLNRTQAAEIERLREVEREYHNEAAALVTPILQRDTLRAALIEHRADLHNRSKRPCPTCRQSAQALGIKVPDTCAYPDTDRAALALLDAAEGGS